MTTIPFAVETVRNSPIRIPQRSLVIAQGDDITLAVQVYDGAGAAVDLTGAEVTVTIWRQQYEGAAWHDYGMAWLTAPGATVYQAKGTILDVGTGKANISLPRGVTSGLSGRYGFSIALDDDTSGAELASGVLDVRRAAIRPILGPEGSVVIGDGTITTEVVFLVDATGQQLVTESGDFIELISFSDDAAFIPDLSIVTDAGDVVVTETGDTLVLS